MSCYCCCLQWPRVVSTTHTTTMILLFCQTSGRQQIRRFRSFLSTTTTTTVIRPSCHHNSSRQYECWSTTIHSSSYSSTGMITMKNNLLTPSLPSSPSLLLLRFAGYYPSPCLKFSSSAVESSSAPSLFVEPSSKNPENNSNGLEFLLSQSAAARHVWKSVSYHEQQQQQQHDDLMLSPGEQALHKALLKYFQVITTQQQHHHQYESEISKERQKATTSAATAALLAISNAFQDLEYWQDALLVEESPHGLAAFYSKHDDDAAAAAAPAAATSHDDDVHSLHDYADWLYRRGKLHCRLKQYVTAQRLHRQALQVHEQKARLIQLRHEHRPEHADSGNQASENNDVVVMDSSSSSNTEKVVVHDADMGHVLISMAGIAFARENYPHALELLVQAEPHFRFHRHHHDHASSRQHGTIATSSATIAAAVASASSLSLLQQRQQLSGVHPDLVKCLQHQGLVHRSLEDYAAALDVYQQALLVLDDDTTSSSSTSTSHVKRIEDYEEKRQGLQMDLADMLAALERNDEALLMYQAIWDHHDELLQSSEQQDHTDSSTTTTNALHGVLLYAMGRIHAQQGHYDLAQKQLLRALRIKEQVALGNSSDAGAAGAGGSTHGTSADHDMNDKELSSHVVFHPEVGKTLQALGAVYAMQKESDRDNTHLALQCFQKALQIAIWQAKMEVEHQQHDSNVVVEHKNDSNSIRVNQHPEVMLVLRNIAILKGEKVPKWGEAA